MFLGKSGYVNVDKPLKLDYDKLEMLSEITKDLFANISDMDETITIIAKSGQSFLNVKRCTMWILDPESDEHLIARACNHPQADKYFRVPFNTGLVGWTASHKKLLNVPDAYQDPRFNSAIDEQTGYRTKSVLCIPIFSNTLFKSDTVLEHQRSHVSLVGVMQLLHHTPLSQMAELLGTFFCEYAGVAISNCEHYRQLQNSKRRTNILMDIMTYHYNIDDTSITNLFTRLNSPEFKDILEKNNIIDWKFSPRVLSIENSVALAFWMFEDLGIIERFKIVREKLARFILSVQKSYRDVPYHNWYHAISVTHFSYVLLKLCPFHLHLTQLQMDMLPIAAITHDVDHRGTNNAFQKVSMSDLAALYSSEGSILERHHLAQTMCLLNIQSCAILENLPHKDYVEAVDILQHLILTTDIAKHLKAMPQMEQLFKEGKYNNLCKKDQLHLIGLMMTCCDLSQLTKDIDTSLNICELIYEEFHTQGDIEKAKGHTPIPMMDRDASDKPKEQIGFINYLGMPAFSLLASLVPEAQPNVDNIKQLLEYWTAKQI